MSGARPFPKPGFEVVRVIPNHVSQFAESVEFEAQLVNTYGDENVDIYLDTDWDGQGTSTVFCVRSSALRLTEGDTNDTTPSP